ncbi:MAG: site-specific integrase [Acidimicrobiales bacterium]
MASIEPWRWDLCPTCRRQSLRRPWPDCQQCKVTAWRCHWRDDRNRPQSKVVQRKIDARSHLRKVGADLERGEYIPPKVLASKFDEWADRWWRTTAKLSAHTRRGYYVLLENHVRPYLHGVPLDNIDWDMVEEFLNEKLEVGYAPKRVRDMVSVVSLIMKTAIRKGARKDNPAAQHTIPQRARKVRQGDVLDMDQALRLVASTRDPYKPTVWLLVLLGLRPAELCGLTVGAVDFARCQVHVTETLNAVHSFPGHGYGLEIETTKTEAGDRTLPIPIGCAMTLPSCSSPELTNVACPTSGQTSRSSNRSRAASPSG